MRRSRHFRHFREQPAAPASRSTAPGCPRNTRPACPATMKSFSTCHAIKPTKAIGHILTCHIRSHSVCLRRAFGHSAQGLVLVQAPLKALDRHAHGCVVHPASRYGNRLSSVNRRSYPRPIRRGRTGVCPGRSSCCRGIDSVRTHRHQCTPICRGCDGLPIFVGGRSGQCPDLGDRTRRRVEHEDKRYAGRRDVSEYFARDPRQRFQREFTGNSCGRYLTSGFTHKRKPTMHPAERCANSHGAGCPPHHDESNRMSPLTGHPRPAGLPPSSTPSGPML